MGELTHELRQMAFQGIFYDCYSTTKDKHEISWKHLSALRDLIGVCYTIDPVPGIVFVSDHLVLFDVILLLESAIFQQQNCFKESMRLGWDSLVDELKTISMGVVRSSSRPEWLSEFCDRVNALPDGKAIIDRTFNQ